MRASRRLQRGGAARKTAGRRGEIHVSGAEAMCEERQCARLASEFLKRALHHPRGEPDTVIITVEKICDGPERRPLLPFSTLPCASPPEAEETIRAILREAGVSARAIHAGMRILASPGTMRGASLVSAVTGRRLEPDRERGVRVSRLGIEKASLPRLRRRLARAGIDTATVREALILASKVASCEEIVAEVCISDDPDYTTGYVACRKRGYLRIPHIKAEGTLHGGRVFFAAPDSSVSRIMSYLQTTPVMLYLQASARESQGAGRERPDS